MSQPFLSSLDCRQIPKHTFIKENLSSKVNPPSIDLSKPSKIVYSLREKKYVLKQPHTMIALKIVRKRSKENVQQKQNFSPLFIPKAIKKPFQIQQQLNLSIVPFNASVNPSPYNSLIIKFKPIQSIRESCYKYDNLRSTQETQLCGAQLGQGINNNRTVGKKISCSRDKQYKCEGRLNVGKGLQFLLKGKIEQSLLNLADSGNYQHHSILRKQDSNKLPLHKLKKSNTESPPSHQLSITTNLYHELNLREPLTLKKTSNNSSTFATHASNAPSTRSRMGSNFHRFNEMSIRSTRSIKEEESMVEEFSQVLVQSPMKVGKRKVSLVQRISKVER